MNKTRGLRCGGLVGTLLLAWSPSPVKTLAAQTRLPEPVANPQPAAVTGDIRTFAAVAKKTVRPAGFPRPSAVCFSSRFKHPANSQDPHDIFQAAADFHATGFYWINGPNKEWFVEIKKRGYPFQGWLSTILPDTLFGSTRQRGRIVDEKGPSDPGCRAARQGPDVDVCLAEPVVDARHDCAGLRLRQPHHRAVGRVYHCVDTSEKPQPFRLRVDPAGLSGDRLFTVDLLVPARYERAVHAQAERTKDFTPLAVQKRLAGGCVTEFGVPAVAPWGLIVIAPDAAARAEVWPPSIMADDAGLYAAQLSVRLSSMTRGAVIHDTFWCGNQYHAGDVAEVLAFDRHLPDSQREGLEQYLAEKYKVRTTRLWE